MSHLGPVAHIHALFSVVLLRLVNNTCHHYLSISVVKMRGSRTLRAIQGVKGNNNKPSLITPGCLILQNIRGKKKGGGGKGTADS